MQAKHKGCSAVRQVLRGPLAAKRRQNAHGSKRAGVEISRMRRNERHLVRRVLQRGRVTSTARSVEHVPRHRPMNMPAQNPVPEGKRMVMTQVPRQRSDRFARRRVGIMRVNPGDGAMPQGYAQHGADDPLTDPRSLGVALAAIFIGHVRSPCSSIISAKRGAVKVRTALGPAGEPWGCRQRVQADISDPPQTL